MLIMLALSQDAASDPKMVMIPDFKPPQREERPVAGCAEYGWPGTQRPTVLRTRRGRFASCHQCESRRGLGRPGRLTTWSKERGKRQSEFGMEMQSHEVSGGNAKLPDESNTRLLMQSTPAQGSVIDPHGYPGQAQAIVTTSSTVTGENAEVNQYRQDGRY